MKEYSFNEVIEGLMKDNTLQYESHIYVVQILDEALTLVNKNSSSKYNTISTEEMQDKYMLVKKPVSYTEALQAFAKGKVIEVEKFDTTNNKPRNYVLNSDMHNFEFCLDDMKYGIWYILD